MRQQGVQVVAVEAGSLAERAGIRPGDRILEINGEAVLDQLNYQYLVSLRDHTRLKLLQAGGVERSVRVPNGGDGLGLDLAQDPVKVCRQDCVFCFVRQMPKGFRKTLYLKDEDIRLSFLYGHFSTLSSSDEAELDRIIRERLSPLHVSVHATDPEARVRLLRNPMEGDILRKVDRLLAGGIQLHTQVVVTPGWNDGDVWERTLAELWERRAYGPSGLPGGILSLSCVPVGLTGHREGLTPLAEFDAAGAAAWARRWTPEARRLRRENGDEPWLLLADEWFTRAGLEPPARSFYSRTWEQLENGVGMVRRFLEQSGRFIRSPRARAFRGRRLLLLTGASFAPTLERRVAELNRAVGAHLRVLAVPNRSFGTSVTVAGLLCGADLLGAARRDLAQRGPVEAVIVPSASLTTLAGPTGQYQVPGAPPSSAGVFLDDLRPADLARELGLPVLGGGEGFSQILRVLEPPPLV